MKLTSENEGIGGINGEHKIGALEIGIFNFVILYYYSIRPKKF